MKRRKRPRQNERNRWVEKEEESIKLKKRSMELNDEEWIYV